ncbi:MAG TPA: class III extradiol ring-cleavage dioxygenase [Holophagaceae bacterium]|jgi:4,5-DOPA dioxygenase extradiol|nr:class III extradiol ring-cleavage dioxygenase [Holophagaceae bacterium]
MRQPVLFISHGSPMRALEGGAWGDALRGLGQSLDPVAILVVSAHWETEGAPRVTASPQPGVIHDFYGFPEPLYGLDYPSPGSLPLAERILACLRKTGIEAVLDPERPLDHGAWAPLIHLFPKADRPVLQLSEPLERTPRSLYAMGQALAQLREEGLLIIGSGGIVHNLRRLEWGSEAAPEAWAGNFDAWAASRLEAGDADALLDWRRKAPDPALAHPRSEHWDPLFAALGAAGDAKPRTVFEGWEHRNLSLRSLIWD